LYIALALWVYNFNVLDGFLEIIRIPFIEYLSVLVLAGIFWLILRLVGLVRKQPAVGSAVTA
jgi:hypothetical protein